MNKPKKIERDPRWLAGVQLALFEVVWPAFPWIEAIYMATSGHVHSLGVLAESKPDEPEWHDCQRILSEVMEVALPKPAKKIELTLWLRPPVPGSEFVEIMSQSVFNVIAAEVAPWRLASGR